MNETYEYRRFKVAAGDWDHFAERLRGEGAREATARGGTLFGVWRGQIGLEANEGITLTAWPDEPTPPPRTGVYAFRFFSIVDEHFTEFADLSARAWPGFESSYDAKIYGFFRSLDVRPPDARVLLLTRYASLAVWEASRADTGRSEFQRRHKLTRATIVCTALPG